MKNCRGLKLESVAIMNYLSILFYPVKFLAPVTTRWQLASQWSLAEWQGNFTTPD